MNYAGPFLEINTIEVKCIESDWQVLICLCHYEHLISLLATALRTALFCHSTLYRLGTVDRPPITYI